MTANSCQELPNDAGRPLKVLVLSRNYPNQVLPILGLWVESTVRLSKRFCTPKVIAPVPYCPPLPWLPEKYARFRRIKSHQVADGVEIFRPRFLIPPGFWYHGFESITYFLGVVSLADRLRRGFPFDLIHAHFTYPDGYVAAQLGRRYGIPVIITEHAPWHPWLENYPRVRRQAIWASEQCSFHIPVSASVRDSIVQFTGGSQKLHVIPVGVDDSTFTLESNGTAATSQQILFVGIFRPVKGVDILLKAMRLLTDCGRNVRLVLVGEGFYESYRREYHRLLQMVGELNLRAQVEFVGMKQGPELARYMQQSALLVLPSRQESFGLVLVEALACGTPVVATRCGGPEDIVNEEVGVLVPKEDPQALAWGIERVLDRRTEYDPARLRAYAVGKFGLQSVTRRIVHLYEQAVAGTRSNL